MPRRHWLFKSEPDVFSFDDLRAAPRGRTGWDGIRNYQARNLLRDDVQVGDGVLYYHSNAKPTGVVGIARVTRAGHPDPTQFDPASPKHDPKADPEDPTWIQVEVEAVAPCPQVVTLADLKGAPELASMLVVQRGQRLSVQPVTPEEWRAVWRRAGFPKDPLGTGAGRRAKS